MPQSQHIMQHTVLVYTVQRSVNKHTTGEATVLILQGTVMTTQQVTQHSLNI